MDVVVQPVRIQVAGVQPVAMPVVSSISVYRGLIDTGANTTCITKRAAHSIGLRPRGKRRVGSVRDIDYHNQYRFELGAFYDADGVRGYYMFDEVYGVEFRDNDDFDVLIGMDIIMRGDLTMGRNGRFTWVLP